MVHFFRRERRSILWCFVVVRNIRSWGKGKGRGGGRNCRNEWNDLTLFHVEYCHRGKLSVISTFLYCYGFFFPNFRFLSSGYYYSHNNNIRSCFCSSLTVLTYRVAIIDNQGMAFSQFTAFWRIQHTSLKCSQRTASLEPSLVKALLFLEKVITWGTTKLGWTISKIWS